VRRTFALLLVGLLTPACTSQPAAAPHRDPPTALRTNATPGLGGASLTFGYWLIGGNVPPQSLSTRAALYLYADRLLLARAGGRAGGRVTGVRLSEHEVEALYERLLSVRVERLPDELTAIKARRVGLATDVFQICAPNVRRRISAYGLSQVGHDRLLPTTVVPVEAVRLNELLNGLETRARQAPTWTGDRDLPEVDLQLTC
jgi:hypothetical protein